MFAKPIVFFGDRDTLQRHWKCKVIRIYYSHRSLNLDLDELRFNPCFKMVTWYLVKNYRAFLGLSFLFSKNGNDRSAPERPCEH